MKEWEARQKHHEDTTRILTDGGFMDSQRRIRAWDGSVIWPQLAELGHYSMDFNKCKCKEGINDEC